MEKRSFTIGIALVLLLAGAGNSAEAKTRHVRCTFSSTFTVGVETHLDTNGDGVSANLIQGVVNCNIGRFFFQAETEYQAPVAPVTCPVGTQEFHLQQAHGVDTEEKTSDQLFEEDATNAVTLCLNPDLTFSFTEHGTFAGGTGQFTGASGSFDVQGTGKFLVFGVKDGVLGGFGQSSGTSTGTLILPKGNDKSKHDED